MADSGDEVAASSSAHDMATANKGTVVPGIVLGEDLGHDLAGAALALARRFATGGTMWCLAPASPEHARHVAVEFVHPVIVGKRALTRRERDRPRSDGCAQATARRGDIRPAVGAADSAGVAARPCGGRRPGWTRGPGSDGSRPRPRGG